MKSSKKDLYKKRLENYNKSLKRKTRFDSLILITIFLSTFIFIISVFISDLIEPLKGYYFNICSSLMLILLMLMISSMLLIDSFNGSFTDIIKSILISFILIFISYFIFPSDYFKDFNYVKTNNIPTIQSESVTYRIEHGFRGSKFIVLEVNGLDFRIVNSVVRKKFFKLQNTYKIKKNYTIQYLPNSKTVININWI